MIVLSIHDGHDSGATLVQDGRILLHSSEERRVNVKNKSGIPRESIQTIFARTGIEPKDVDQVALVGTIRNATPVLGKYRIMSTVMNTAAVLARSETATKLGRAALAKVRRKKDMLGFLADYGLADTSVKTYDHHLCHAACAYYHRPFEGEALVLTHDGAGDGLCATVSIGRGNDLEVIAQTPKYHSLANFLYSFITMHLGLKPWEHEYKIMGMAPYGRAEYCVDILRDMWGVEGMHFRNRTGHGFNSLSKYYRKKLAGQRFDNLCAATQQVFEELSLKWVQNAVEATGIHKVCGAGGAFLNVKANGLIRECDEVEAFYAYPASDDGGTPVGGAILGYLAACREKGVEPTLDLPKSMYLGLDFTEEDMEKAAKASGHPYKKMDNPADELGSMLADGQIIARFDGREEVGPRALGNRTIMADPRDLRVIRKLNFAIKKRDFWMPFAASVLDEDADTYMEQCSPWAFWMIEAFRTKPIAEHDIISGLHPMDLTVRPQVVNELNPGYRDVIRAFKKRTGVGAILNTSFNLHGFPVVGTPEVAIHTLENSDLDGLALGSYLVWRKDKPAPFGESKSETEAAMSV